MNITHTPEDQILELPGSTFYPGDPPTPAELTEMLQDDGFQVDGGPVDIIEVAYVDGRWVAEYDIPEPDFEAIAEARRQDPDPDFHRSTFYDITSRR